ncbi:alpha/beta hydrolase-fold protein [Formosa algae]|uniref:alpha/beta hydrolase-fold protein n=1 Tax=Formosa algae TaxID=225843 RepID=UPI001559C2C4|nr:alpha/beta hydrolase-fold protein [Formosa algae]
MKKIYLISLCFILIGSHVDAQQFEVNFNTNLRQDSFTGQVLLYMSKVNTSPKDIAVGLELTPVFRVSVTDLKPGEAVRFDDHAISYPVALSNIERGTYYVQAVFDLNLGDGNIGSGTGNLYSEPVRVEIDKAFLKVIQIEATKSVKPIRMYETDYLKEFKVQSPLLSAFHNTAIFVNAAVSLPKDYYKQPDKTYPVIFSIFGFGANYKLYSGHNTFLEQLGDQPTIVIYLDGNCPEGHSTYANSDVNGPWGDALVKEFIPALQKTYRTNGAFLLHGHSSGGWTSLWLQVNYPKTFVGAWASAPDQVDFRNYQDVNIYDADNIYYNSKGQSRPLFTIAGRFPVTFSKDFYQTEDVIYRGSQLHAFDAVFGGYDTDGKRIRLVDDATGKINKNAIPLWKRYDLSILLRNHWDSLKKDLNGKIRISVGTSDNIFLNRSVALLEKEMNALKAQMEFSYVSGDHFTLFTDEYKQAGTDFLVQCYQNWLQENP